MAYEVAMQALADPTRRAVFERLREGPLAAGLLADGLPVSRPAVSQHLRALKSAGLVNEAREGTRRIYSIRHAGLQALRDYLDSFWDTALTNYKEALERDVRGDDDD